MMPSLLLHKPKRNDRPWVIEDEIAEEQWQDLRDHVKDGLCGAKGVSVTSPFACHECRDYLEIRARLLRKFKDGNT